MAIFLSFAVIAILGLILGIGLAFADKKLKVEKDEKLLLLEEAMPGANCGGCGYAGCSAYAEAVFKGEAEPGLCSPGGQALAEKMGEILGVKVDVKEKMVAFIACRGNSEVTKKSYEYKGMEDCNALSLLLGGNLECKEGCLHMGSCAKVCPAGAISLDSENSYVVDKEKCIGCKKCVAVCPNGVIRMVPYSAEYLVACNSTESGAKVRKSCQRGCIGCRICVNKVDSSPFVVENNLSRNDYSKNQENAAKAAELCPAKCIIRR